MNASATRRIVFGQKRDAKIYVVHGVGSRLCGKKGKIYRARIIRSFEGSRSVDVAFKRGLRR